MAETLVLAPQFAKTGKQSVSPSEVTSALDKIRTSAALESPGFDSKKNGTAPQVRSTLSNLIFLRNELSSPSADTDNLDSARDFSIEELVSDLCLSHPSRFLVASLNSDSEGIQTAVSSQCVIANSGAHVCSEEVYISVNEEVSGYLAHYLLSLLVPDVPAVLVVLGDIGIEGEAFHTVMQSVAEISDKIIFDSGTFSHLDSSARSLRRGDFEEPLQLCDLTWMKISRWRELISEQFESGSGGVKSTENISNIDIFFKQDGSHEQAAPVEALLLTSWIVDSLGAQVRSVLPLSDGGMELVLKKKQKFKIQLLPVEDSTQVETSIQKVEFSMGSGDLFCSFSIRRVNSEDAEVSIGFSSEATGADNSCELNVRHVSFARDDRRLLLTRALNQPSSSETFQRIFEKMLTITKDEED
jgi:glucose-6-phosphate dehydrogenase assembly protein OpcA